MKSIINLLLVVFALTSCQESIKVEGVTDENAHSTYDSFLPTPTLIEADTITNLNLTNKIIDSILPTPDPMLFVDIDSSDVNGMLLKYLEYYKIESSYTDNNDGSYVIKLEDYILEEVKQIVKALLPTENEPKSELDGWHEGVYYYEGMCNLEIRQEQNIIIIEYGCSC